jgi:hypothetical protein
MPTTKTITNDDAASRQKITNVNNGWGRVLADAEIALGEAQSRARSLKRAIRTNRSKVSAGEAFPVSNVSPQN